MELRNRAINISIGIISFLLFYYNMQLIKHLKKSNDTLNLIIIGGGLAGLTTALEAHHVATMNKFLIKILLIEKENKIGGNSAKASSGINGVFTPQDIKEYEKDTFLSGNGLSNTDLVNVLTNNSGNAIHFLQEYGVDLSIKTILGGHSKERTYRNKDTGSNIGYVIIHSLLNKINTLNNIEIITHSKVINVKKSSLGTIYEVYCDRTNEPKNKNVFHAENIVFSTGGFSANKDLLNRFSPDKTEFPTTNGPWATGDGITIGENLGANLIHMNKIQLHPTSFIDPKNPESKFRFLAPEAFRGSGALLLNEKYGKRFVNELEKRDTVSNAILLQKPNKYAIMLLMNKHEELKSKLDFYMGRGLVKISFSVKELAVSHSWDPMKLLKELNSYIYHTLNKTEKDEFGKSYITLPTLSPIKNIDAPVELYSMKVGPAIHYCMVNTNYLSLDAIPLGGIEINSKAQVLNADRIPIPGLYAVGETTGGLHGANRLGGNSLTECIVFGRIAAHEIAQSMLKDANKNLMN